MSNFAEIIVDGKTFKLPIVRGTENELAIDISKLRSQSGIITLDPGFKNTGSTTSAITFLDGENGILNYRGYPIDQLADFSTFTEVSYLLIYGDLPSKTELAEFENATTLHTLIHEDFKTILDGFPSKSHPMGVLSSLVTALNAFYPKSSNFDKSPQDINLSIIRLLAKMPTFAAWSFKI